MFHISAVSRYALSLFWLTLINWKEIRFWAFLLVESFRDTAALATLLSPGVLVAASCGTCHEKSTLDVESVEINQRKTREISAAVGVKTSFHLLHNHTGYIVCVNVGLWRSTDSTAAHSFPKWRNVKSRRSHSRRRGSESVRGELIHYKS